jgi:hypothetical protein
VVADRLHRVCGAMTRSLDMSGAAVLLRSGEDDPALVGASDATAAAVADLEHTTGEGPSRDAFTTNRPVLVSDLRDPTQVPWVVYADAVARRGVGAVFAFPLHLGAARFGTLTAYAPSAQQLGTRRTACCLAMAEIATEALLAGADRGGDGRLDPDLDGALGLRSEIYQAQGMVMVMLHTDLATALARMRAHAFGSDSSLLEVSLEILAGRLTFTD